MLTSIIAAISALLGVALTNFFQQRQQGKNQLFQVEIETLKRDSDLTEKNRIITLARLEKAHKILSFIDREFSLTKFHINWRMKIAESEYDDQYLTSCDKMDELRVIGDLYEPSLSADIEDIYTQMNIFWGSFRNILYRTHKGDSTDEITKSNSFQDANKSSNDILRQIKSLKGKISDISCNINKIANKAN